MVTGSDIPLEGLQHLIEALAFKLANSDLSEDSSEIHPPDTRAAILQRPFMPKFAYLSPPLGLIPLDNTYELICVSDMSSTRFWNYVQERLELDNDLMDAKNERLIIEGYRLKRIPSLGQATIIICYARYNEHYFSGSAVLWSEARRRHFLVDKDCTAQELNIAEAYDSQEITRIVNDKAQSTARDLPDVRQKFASTFYTFREWANYNGMLSSRFRLLTEKVLFTLLAQAFTELDINSDEPVLPRLWNLEPFAENFHNHFRAHAMSGRCLIEANSKQYPTWTIDGLFYSRAERLPPYPPNTQPKGLEGFFSESDYILKVHGTSWGTSHKQRLQFVEAMTDVILSLHLGRLLWPFSFVDEMKTGEAIYLIGCAGGDWWHNSRTPPRAVYLEKALEQLTYDRNVMAVTTELLTCAEAQGFVESLKDQGQTSIAVATSTTEKSRFRTAAAVMSRLRWDDAHSGADYEVGYIDRFENDLMWKALEKWEKHTEEEEFIPEHRIMKVRRVRDGEVVWDREKRQDKT